MFKRYALTKLFRRWAAKRSQTIPKVILTNLVILSGLYLLQAQNRPRGDSIGGTLATSTNKPKQAAIVQTNALSISIIRTNAAGEYVIGFDALSGYPMQLPDNLISNTNQAAWADVQVNGMIPAAIKALDGKKVRIEGFMLPTSWGDKGKVTNFLLMRNQISCCYGGPSQVHEFVTISIQGKGVKSEMESTVLVGGVLHVGAIRENGQLVGIYRLETEGYSVPPAN